VAGVCGFVRVGACSLCCFFTAWVDGLYTLQSPVTEGISQSRVRRPFLRK